jgi:hypothetical protein
MTTDFKVTRDQIISGALRLCGVLAQGETPTATQVTEAAEALNLMVKAWEADGMPLWAIKKYTITLVDGQAEYEIGVGKAINTAKPLKIIQAMNHDTQSSVDIPIRIVAQKEYQLLGNKTTTGNPIQLFYQPFNDYGVVTVYPVPDATSADQKVMSIVYQRPFEDFDAAGDYPDFPQEWHEAIKYGLASRLAGDYQIDLETRKVIMSEAQQFKEIAKSFGTEEGSLYFSVNRQNF